MMRCRSPSMSASSSMSRSTTATSHDDCIAVASHSPAPAASSAKVRRSRLRWRISPGSPSPSMNSTPSSCRAAAAFRSGAPSYGLNAGSRRRRGRRPLIGERVQRPRVTLQDHGLFPRRGRIELLVLAVERRHVQHRGQQRCQVTRRTLRLCSSLASVVSRLPAVRQRIALRLHRPATRHRSFIVRRAARVE